MRWSAVLLLFMACSYVSANFQTKVLLKWYEDCSRTDWQSCLKIKLLTNLEKFGQMANINVVDGLSLVNEQFSSEGSQAVGDPFVSEKVKY